MASKKRSKGQSTPHHHSGSGKGRVAGVHIPEMNFPFVGDCGSAKQTRVAIEEIDGRPPSSQHESNAATLYSAPENSDMHHHIFFSV